MCLSRSSTAKSAIHGHDENGAFSAMRATYQIPVELPPSSLPQRSFLSTSSNGCPAEECPCPCTVSGQWLRNQLNKAQEPFAMRANPQIDQHRGCIYCMQYKLSSQRQLVSNLTQVMA